MSLSYRSESLMNYIDVKNHRPKPLRRNIKISLRICVYFLPYARLQYPKSRDGEQWQTKAYLWSLTQACPCAAYNARSSQRGVQEEEVLCADLGRLGFEQLVWESEM